MKNIAAIAAVAGTAALAAGQVTVSVIPTATTVDTSTATSVSVSVVVEGISFDTGLAIVDGGIGTAFDSNLNQYDLVATVSGSTLSGLNLPEGTSFATTSTTDTTASAADLAAVQGPFSGFGSALVGGGDTFDPAAPILLFTFDVAVGSSDIEISLAEGSSGVAIATSPPSLADVLPLNDAGAELVGATITVVPTPGALAVLGLGGLAAARRRR